MKFWQAIKNELQKEHPVALLYVLQSEGSSPGRQGFKMMVSARGQMDGSIGGGMMEYNMVEIAKKLVLQPDIPPQIHRLVHRKNQKDSSGLICSGEQTVAIYVLAQKDKTWVDTLLKYNQKGVLTLSEKGIQFSPYQSLTQKFNTKISPTDWLVQEDLAYHPTLHIIGGGHVSLALSQLAPALGFQVFVYDDRQDINTFTENPYAKTLQVTDYQDIAQFIPQGERHYVVIMSFMFDTDLLILRKLLPQKIKYLGMMGSKQKVKTLLYRLAQEGYANEINHLYAPIGLDIHSQTPAEIAVSILAQMIKIKNS